MNEGWIDVTVPLHNGIEVWPGDEPYNLTTEDHGDYRVSKLTSTVHVGTHIDAPSHFVKGAATIDQFPLEVAIGPAAVVREIQQFDRLLFKTKNELPDATIEALVANQVLLVGVEGMSVGSAEAHQKLSQAGIWILEGLDLSAVAEGEYDLICLPLPLQGSEASPTRCLLKPR